jgi:ureidoacrylate peracid hydrolase
MIGDSMKASETAILLIEFQKEFCYEKGVLYGLVKEQLKAQNAIPNAIDLVEKARKKGCLICHIPICFSQDYKELKEPTGILKAVVDSKAFSKEGAELIDELKPAPEDVVIEGKKTVGSFASTNLDFILRSRGIKNVAIAGFLTNFCVESTVREAYDKGYKIAVLKDCTVATSSEEQRFAEEKVFPAFGEVLAYNEFLEKLE